MVEEKSLKESLAEIAEGVKELKDQKTTKKWNLPFMARVGMGKRKKRAGWIVFANIGINKAVTFIKAQLVEGVAMVNGIPHVVQPEDILIWKNKIPMVIQPQWSERPFSPTDHFKETSAAGQSTNGWQYIMNYILRTQIAAKKVASWGLIILGIVVLIGGGYYLIKSGALGGSAPVK